MSNIPFTLHQIQILQAIVSEGNFNRAAEKLYITQPAVSSQIATLEKSLNVPLFYRTKRKAELTETGVLLNKYCERILDLCEETCRALDEMQSIGTGKLVIGASQTTGTYLLPKLIGLFRHKYPQIAVELRIFSTRQVTWELANGQVDIAIVGGEVPKDVGEELEVATYAEDELALILPTTHPFSALPYIQKDDLYRLRFIALNSQSTIRDVIEKTLVQNGIDSRYFKIEMELNSIEAIKNAVQSGLGAAFVSYSAISKEIELGVLRAVKIEGVTIKRNLFVVTNPARYGSTVAQIFKREIL